MNQFDNPHEWLDCPLIEIDFEIFTKRICSILSRIRFTLGKDLHEHTLKFCPIKSFLPLARMGKTFHNWKHLVRTQSLTALVCLVFWRNQSLLCPPCLRPRQCSAWNVSTLSPFSPFLTGESDTPFEAKVECHLFCLPDTLTPHAGESQPLTHCFPQ